MVERARYVASIPVFPRGKDIPEPAVLYLRRNPNDPIAAGSWTNPGGRTENGEEPQHAAARELREETGMRITPRKLAPFGTFTHTYVEPSTKDEYLTEVHAFGFLVEGMTLSKVRLSDEHTDKRLDSLTKLRRVKLHPSKGTEYTPVDRELIRRYLYDVERLVAKHNGTSIHLRKEDKKKEATSTRSARSH